MPNLKANINVMTTMRPYQTSLSLQVLQLSATGLRPLSMKTRLLSRTLLARRTCSVSFLCLYSPFSFFSLRPATSVLFLLPFSFLAARKTDQLLLQLSSSNCLAVFTAWPNYTHLPSLCHSAECAVTSALSCPCCYFPGVTSSASAS